MLFSSVGFWKWTLRGSRFLSINIVHWIFFILVFIQFGDFSFSFLFSFSSSYSYSFSFRSEERYYNHFRFYFVLVHDNNTVIDFFANAHIIWYKIPQWILLLDTSYLVLNTSLLVLDNGYYCLQVMDNQIMYPSMHNV